MKEQREKFSRAATVLAIVCSLLAVGLFLLVNRLSLQANPIYGKF